MFSVCVLQLQQIEWSSRQGSFSATEARVRFPKLDRQEKQPALASDAVGGLLTAKHTLFCRECGTTA